MVIIQFMNKLTKLSFIGMSIGSLIGILKKQSMEDWLIGYRAFLQTFAEFFKPQEFGFSMVNILGFDFIINYLINFWYHSLLSFSIFLLIILIIYDLVFN